MCISILHEPGDDTYGYEKASERWLPVHTVETILISVISMLADPNDESPANVDAAVSTQRIVGVRRCLVSTVSARCPPGVSGVHRECLVSAGSVWCSPGVSGVHCECLVSTGSVWCPP